MSEQALPIIAVSDIAAVRCFYEQLGFLQTCQFPSEGEPGFVWTKRGAASVGIGAQGANELDRFSMWVDVDDVDPALDVLRAAGAPVVAEPEDQPWGGRVAQTRDPDGDLAQPRRGAPTDSDPSGSSTALAHVSRTVSA